MIWRFEPTKTLTTSNLVDTEFSSILSADIFIVEAAPFILSLCMDQGLILGFPSWWQCFPYGFFFLLQSLGFFCNLRKKNLLHCCLASHKNQLFSLLGNVFAKGWTRHKASSTFHARTASLESLSFLWGDGVLQTRPWTMWVFFFVLFLLFISHVLQFTLTNVAVSLRLRN